MSAMNESVSRYRMLGLIPRSSAKRSVILTGSQARVARGLLGWTQADLAKRAKVTLADVREIEGDKTLPAATLTRVRHAFETARVEILGSASPRLRA